MKTEVGEHPKIGEKKMKFLDVVVGVVEEKNMMKMRDCCWLLCCCCY